MNRSQEIAMWARKNRTPYDKEYANNIFKNDQWPEEYTRAHGDCKSCGKTILSGNNICRNCAREATDNARFFKRTPTSEELQIESYGYDNSSHSPIKREVI